MQRIELTEEQLRALENPGTTPPRVVNPRTKERRRWGCRENCLLRAPVLRGPAPQYTPVHRSRSRSLVTTNSLIRAAASSIAS